MVLIPDDWVWNTDIGNGHETLIASHVLEHMKIAQVDQLLTKLPSVRRLYVDAPLPEKASAWDGGESSHIIEVGWIGLRALFQKHRYRQTGSMDGKWGPAYWFVR
jgi:hypothetical protein